MNELWAIEPTYLQKYLEQIENASFEDREKAFEIFGSDTLTNETLTIRGETAYITIKGSLLNKPPSYVSRLFGFNATIYQDIIDSILKIQGNETIKEVRLIMDTPGGAVDGCDETYQALVELKKHKKVIAISTGMIASAGYWLASAADEIWATAPTNEFGSIGIVVAFTSWKNYDEKAGIKEITIVSKNAPKKMPDVDTKEGQDIIRDRIDAIERVFINRIAEGRKIDQDTIIKDFGQGSILIAKDPDSDKPDAISVKMIDALKFDMVIQASCGKKKKAEDVFNHEDIQAGSVPGEPSGENQEIDDSLENAGTDQPLEGNQVNGNQENQNNETERKGIKMDLFEFLKENAGAQAQFDQAIEKAKKEGIQSGHDRVDARVKKAVPYLTGEYPEAIKTLAAKVVSGESEFSSLEGAVVMYDVETEKKKAEAAAGETEETGETPPTGETGITQDGTLETEEDLQAAVQRATAVRPAA